MIYLQILKNGAKNKDKCTQIYPLNSLKRMQSITSRKKGFAHIGADIKAIMDEWEKGNLIGTEIPGLKIPADGHTFKVRSANTDTKAGQSNGYRIIYYVVRDDAEEYLLMIYYKKTITGYRQIRKSLNC